MNTLIETCMISLPCRFIIKSMCGLVHKRFRSNPNVFITTFTSESLSNRKICSIPNVLRINVLIFCSAWKAIFCKQRSFLELKIYVPILNLSCVPLKPKFHLTSKQDRIFWLNCIVILRRRIPLLVLWKARIPTEGYTVWTR